MTFARAAYDAAGNRASVSYPNGVQTSYSHDARNRLRRIETQQGAATVLQGLTYTLNANGTRASLTEDSGRTVAFTYDALDRLTEEAVTDPSLGNRTTRWTYDAVGNRLSETTDSTLGTETVSYAYDANDRLLTESGPGGTTAYSYDAGGNLTERLGPRGTTAYTWTDDDRLASATDTAGTVSYSYDAEGIRHSRTVAGVTTNYLVDPNRAFAEVVAEEDALGNALTRYTHADELIAQRRAGATAFYHGDALGSTRLLTDAAGNVTDEYVYDAFGETEAESGPTENAYRFTGEAFDEALGLYYLRARYMDPGVGRFLGMDPFAGIPHDPLSLHKYIYVHANPTGAVDPTGKFQISALTLPSLFTSSLGRAVLFQAARSPVKRVLRTAAVVAAGAIISTSTRQKEDPDRPPMFFVGSDHPDVRDHILLALSERGIRPIVNRRGSPHDRGWLRNRSLTRGSCGPGLTGKGTGKDCDEFPMAIHVQGGRDNFLRGRVSIQPADSVQNSSIGGLIRSFHARCKIPLDTGPASIEDAYIMAATNAATHSICGNRR